MSEQRFQIVEDDQDAVFAEQFAESRQEGAEFARTIDQVDQLQATKLLLQRLSEVQQRERDLLAVVGSFEPDEVAEPVDLFVLPGEFVRAGGLASAGHAVKQHAGSAAVRGQRTARFAQFPHATDQPLVLGGQLSQPRVSRDLLVREVVVRTFGRNERQPGRLATEQRGSRDRQRGITPLGPGGVQQSRQRQLHGAIERLFQIEDVLVQRLAQVDRELIPDREPHRQHGTIEFLGERLGQHGQRSRGGGRIGRHIGTRNSVATTRLQTQPTQRLFHRRRRRQTGGQRDPLQSASRGLQQIQQLVGRDQVGRAVLFLQHQVRRETVAGEMQHVPTRPFPQQFVERAARDSVLQHAQIEVPAAIAGQRPQPFLELMPLVPQIERRFVDRQAEDRQHAKRPGIGVRFLTAGGMSPAGNVLRGASVKDQADVPQRQRPTVDVPQLQRSQQNLMIERLARRFARRAVPLDAHMHGDRPIRRLLQHRRSDRSRHMLPDP